MKRYQIFILLFFVLMLPTLSKCKTSNPNQVIEKYYKIVMNTCRACGTPQTDLSRPQNNPGLAKLLTRQFSPIAEKDFEQVSLPLHINNCKEKNNKATCDVTYFIIGQWNYYDPFCERHFIRTVTFNLLKISGTWKINSIIEDGIEHNSDNSNLISIPFILKRIDKDIKYSCSKKWLKKWCITLKLDKRAIKKIEKRALKYEIKNNEVFIKKLACPQISKQR